MELWWDSELLDQSRKKKQPCPEWIISEDQRRMEGEVYFNYILNIED